VDSADIASAELRPDVKTRTLEQVLRTPVASRRVDTLRRAALFGGALAVSLIVAEACGGVPEAGRPAVFAGNAGLAFAAVVVGFGRNRSMLGRSRATSIGASIVLSAAFASWNLLWTASAGSEVPPHVRATAHCLALAFAVGFLPLSALMYGRRGTFPIHPAATGFAGGVGIGLSAASFVGMSCQLSGATHFLIGHVLPIALLGLTGAAFGTTLLGGPQRLPTARSG
jgi:hypothetical protein